MSNMKIAILTDTDADLSKEDLNNQPIFVLPLSIRCGEAEYRDGVNITVDDVYRRQKTENFSTSLPLREEIDGMFDRIASEGYTHVVVVMIASALSGTMNQMRLAGQDRKDLQVYVYDSKSSSIGVGIIALQAAEYAKQVEEGHITLETFQNKVQQVIDGTKVFFVLDTLEYLQRGGRISKTTEVVGSLLQVKPILTFVEGAIQTAAKIRGRKAVITKLVELVREYMPEPGKVFQLVICDGNNPVELAELEAHLKDAFPDFRRMVRGQVDATLAVHLGPQLLGAGIQVLPEE